MQTSVIGYPRIGAGRELKFAIEKFFKRALSQEALLETAAALRVKHWQDQRAAKVDLIPSGDFSLYDSVLDAAVMLSAVPARYRALALNPLEEYFALARGYQGAGGDVKALSMKKWFNTNYHYLVPEIEDDTEIRLCAAKAIDEFLQAKAAGIRAKPVVVGAYTFLKLARFTGSKSASDIADDVAAAYGELLGNLGALGAKWVQFDEPALVMDMDLKDVALFTQLYRRILASKGGAKALLQTYFGDIRDCYDAAISLDFDGIGLDFVEGQESLNLLAARGFPADKVLFAGVINGKNIWKNDYAATLSLIARIDEHAPRLALSTACSLLHVPYSVADEPGLAPQYAERFAFAREKLSELADLKEFLSSRTPAGHVRYLENRALFARPRGGVNDAVRQRVAALGEDDFLRKPSFQERRRIQRGALGLGPLPTTTIGSFPQTVDVRANRAALRTGRIGREAYEAFNRKKIADCVALQEELGLDVLVHGEFERNDMVEYFGESLDGFVFTRRAWVQSYGTRCVKPPIIWGDVSRLRPMTVRWASYAQSLTDKPVKGMLTGPVTILNWSFPREDIPLRESALQIALAIRQEALDLEAGGIRIIQIDEAALREKLPLRRGDWYREYLDWAIPAFRLVHSGVKAHTQIHTHMCYSEFSDIIAQIDAMDADVISFEASRSDLAIIGALNAAGFRTAVGPGVYDIHSPRVPGVDEIKAALQKMLRTLPAEKLWVNPDCGLKTRGDRETAASLKNMVLAAEQIRKSLETCV